MILELWNTPLEIITTNLLNNNIPLGKNDKINYIHLNSFKYTEHEYLYHSNAYIAYFELMTMI